MKIPLSKYIARLLFVLCQKCHDEKDKGKRARIVKKIAGTLQIIDATRVSTPCVFSVSGAVYCAPAEVARYIECLQVWLYYAATSAPSEAEAWEVIGFWGEDRIEVVGLS